MNYGPKSCSTCHLHLLGIFSKFAMDFGNVPNLGNFAVSLNVLSRSD